MVFLGPISRTPCSQRGQPAVLFVDLENQSATVSKRVKVA